MSQRQLNNHPRRFALTNELHARPFAPIACPGRVLMLSFKEPQAAAERDPAADRAHLVSLIDRHGGDRPGVEVTHYLADSGRFRLKWERHTEFVSYALIEDGAREALFAAELGDHFPQDWLDQAPGRIVTAVEIELIAVADREAALAAIDGPLGRSFTKESLVAAGVLDGAAIALGDFRVHEAGFMRFAVVLWGEVGQRRIGRLVQRLIEIENYRMLSMMALPIARDASARLNEIDRALTDLIARVAADEREAPEQEILAELTELSAEIEALSARTAFRFGAARAYSEIVRERIVMMREERVLGRQLFSEFMLRRFEPAMRTCLSAEARLSDLATRASRIADLLRTRVDVAVQDQNQRLLASMDQRAALQVRLQETVEGLSVVAISYYAVSLATYLIAPVANAFGLDKTSLTALVAVPVIGLVWVLVRRMRKRIMERHGGGG